jgi:hypothetical protein
MVWILVVCDVFQLGRGLFDEDLRVEADLNRVYLQLGVSHSDLFAMGYECVSLLGFC